MTLLECLAAISVNLCFIANPESALDDIYLILFCKDECFILLYLQDKAVNGIYTCERPAAPHFSNNTTLDVSVLNTICNFLSHHFRHGLF